MGRHLSICMLAVMLLGPQQRPQSAEPVFFSMLFPQLTPKMWQEATAAEAVFL